MPLLVLPHRALLGFIGSLVLSCFRKQFHLIKAKSDKEQERVSGRNQANSCCCSRMTMTLVCMKSNKKACCFSSGIYQFHLDSQATLTWPHLAWPPPHITLGAALDNNNLIRPISRCGQGEIIVVIALLHSPVIAFVYHRTMPRPQQPVSGRPGSRAAQYRAGEV